MPPPFPIPSATPQPTYYEILQITPQHLDSHPDPAQALKRAYHRALLIHHPDKRKQPTPTSPPPPSSSNTPSGSITIDLISLSYATLSSPALRSSYDNLLLSQSLSLTQSHSTANSARLFQTGIENVDLDDLSYDEAGEEWYRECRCGNPRGYRFGEGDLEEVADYGEVMVGCADCSLWLRVHFAVVEDDGDGEDGRGGGGEVGRGDEPVAEGGR